MKSTSLQDERPNTSFEANIVHDKENIPSSNPQNDELDDKIEDEIQPTPLSIAPIDGEAKPWRQNMKKMSKSLKDGKINLAFSKILASIPKILVNACLRNFKLI